MSDNIYMPDLWVLLHIVSEDIDCFKVLGSWFGGFISGDAWRLSSGVDSITEESDAFHIKNISGSTYVCPKDWYGMNTFTSTILEGWRQKNANATFEVCVPGDFLTA